VWCGVVWFGAGEEPGAWSLEPGAWKWIVSSGCIVYSV